MRLAAALTLCGLLLALPAALCAQGATGSAQDSALPTAADLEIYADAADSTRFPDVAEYLLLEEATYRVEGDGAYERTMRIVRQPLTDAQADRIGEISLGYDAARQELELEWARVVAADGTVLRAEPVHVQELDQPVAQGAPVYSERKVLRASLGSVNPGEIVDVRYTTRTLEPVLPGDISLTWTVNDTRPVRRTRLVVDAPAGLGLKIQEKNLPRAGTAREEGARVVREWTYEDVEPMEGEPFPAEDNEIQQWIHVTGDLRWNDIARWYAPLLEGRDRVTPEMEAHLAGLVEGAESLADSLRAVQRWVAQDVRYVAVSLGMGGFEPRPANEVLSTGVGDCKDKTILFLALARHMGVEGHPVLVRNGGTRAQPGHVSIRNFNHMIAAIRLAGEWVYLDLTSSLSPFGEIPGALQGRRGLLVRDNGSAEVREIPLSDVEANRSSIVVHGELGPDGSFEGTYTEVVIGAIQYRIRGEFARSLNEDQRRAVRRSIAGRVFAEGARADSLELFDGRDLEVTPRLVAGVTADDVLRELPGVRILPIRLPRYGSAALIERLEEEGRERKFPIDAGQIFGRREHYTEYRYRLPEGWIAELPPSVRADSPFGLYESTYRQDGRELTVTRTARGKDGVLRPEAEPELLEWLRTVHADHVEEIVLRVPEG